MFPQLIVLILLSFISPSFAASQLPLMREIFQEEFNNSYQENQCGENILRLIDAAKNKRIDMSQARIIRIENSGGTDFESVPAMRIREQGKIIDTVYNQYYERSPWGHRHIRPVPKNVRVRHEGPGKWVFYHAILEFEGHIFDFDFTNHPTVLPTREYFKQMFIPPNAEFYHHHRSEFGMWISHENYETYLQRIQDEIILKYIPAESPHQMDLRSIPLRELNLL